MTNSIGKLIWSSIGAVGGTGLVILVGFYFASTGALTQETAKQLSKLTLYFFSGCLMFVNLAESVTWSGIVEMSGIPLFVAVFYLVNWLAAQAGCVLLRVPKLWRFVTASLMFGNNNNWPVALVMALADSHQKDLERKAPSEMFANPKNSLAARGLSYVFIYAMFANLVRWSYGYSLLANSDAEDAPPNPAPVDETSPLLRLVASPPESNPRRVVRLPQRQKSLGTGTDEAWTSYEDNPDSEVDPHPIDTIRSTWTRIANTAFGKFVAALVGPFDNPPMKASLLGMLFALIPQLKSLMFGPGAPFKMLITAPLKHCGQASVPLTLVGLGVSLQKVLLDKRRAAQATTEQIAWQRQVNRAVAFICFWRLIVMPFLAVGMVQLLRPYISLLRVDPMYVLVLLILSSSPTAINLQQIAAVHGHFEGELSWCLLWQYGLVIPIMSASVAAWLYWIRTLDWH